MCGPRNPEANRGCTTAQVVVKGAAAGGDTAAEMFFVAEGAVDIHVELNISAVAQLGPGRYFGEGALVTAEPRTAFVVAAADCRLLVLTRADVQAVLREFPDAERMYKEQARSVVAQARCDGGGGSWGPAMAAAAAAGMFFFTCTQSLLAARTLAMLLALASATGQQPTS